MRTGQKQLARLDVCSVVLLAVLFSWACADGEGEKTGDVSDYIDSVEASVRLGSSSDLTDADRDDVIFRVRNTGDKAIKDLKGNVVFYLPGGEEAGQVSWIFVQENEAMQGVAVGEKKKKWRPLAPGEELILGADKIIFFAGDDRPLQRKLAPHWDDVRAEVVITGLIAE